MNINQKGFSAVEALLIVVIIVVLGGVSWYVYDSQKKTNQALDKTTQAQNDPQKTEPKPKATEPPKDEATNWLLYEPPGKQYKLRLADGWKVRRAESTDNGASFWSYTSLTLRPGVVAQVEVSEGGRGGPFPLSLLYNREDSFNYKRGSKIGAFTTKSGLEGEKYEFVQTEENAGHDLAEGAKEVRYYFKKDAKNVVIIATQEFDLVEKVVSTLEF